MKKKSLSRIVFVLLSFLVFTMEISAKIERYFLSDLNGVKVYFPKDNKTYINEIMNSNDKDKLLYLADMYSEINEEELALYYFNSYKGFNWDFKKKIGEKLGMDFYTKEFSQKNYPEEKEYSNYFRINSLDSLYSYSQYFSTKEDKEKNIYEKLFKYKFEKNDKEFTELYEILEKSVKEKNIPEEVFVFQILKEDFEGAKITSFSKAELFFDLINYMNLTNVDKSIIKSFVEEFKNSFGNKYQKEILTFEINYLLSDSEKVEAIEQYLKESFDDELFEIYFKTSQNLVFLKAYIYDLVFEKRNEKYINYLISLDRTYEDEKYLSQLFDKSYLFSYLEKNNKKSDVSYEKEYIEYLYDYKKYDKLYEYKGILSLEMLKTLNENKYEGIVEIIRNKYPLELEFEDLNDLKYFYFNPTLVFDADLVKDLERQKQLNPVETYYLSIYYGSIGNKEKADELQYGLRQEYNLKK